MNINSIHYINYYYPSTNYCSSPSSEKIHPTPSLKRLSLMFSGSCTLNHSHSLTNSLGGLRSSRPYVSGILGKTSTRKK